MVKKRWRCTFDPTFESGRRRKARGAPLFSQEELDEINPSTEFVAFDTLLQDESLSEEVRGIEIRMTSTCLFRVVKDRATDSHGAHHPGRGVLKRKYLRRHARGQNFMGENLSRGIHANVVSLPPKSTGETRNVYRTSERGFRVCLSLFHASLADRSLFSRVEHTALR